MKIKKLGEELYVPENFSRFHHYYADPGGRKEYTGVTTILGVIAKPALIGWAAKMACEYIRENGRNCTTAGGPVCYEVFDSVLEEARTAHTKKRDTAAEAGTDLHGLVEEYVGHSIEVNGGKPSPQYVGTEPITAFIEWAQKQDIRFIATEQRLYSKSLWVAGTCDLIFEKDGKRYVGDIKTYKKIWDRVPLIQCAGYALMWEEMHEVWRRTDLGTPYNNEDKAIDGYCVICLPKERAFNEAEDVLWSWDVEGDKEAFRSAVRLHRYLNQK